MMIPPSFSSIYFDSNDQLVEETVIFVVEVGSCQLLYPLLCRGLPIAITKEK